MGMNRQDIEKLLQSLGELLLLGIETPFSGEDENTFSLEWLGFPITLTLASFRLYQTNMLPF
jgi:hypothetical protein